MEHEEIHTVKLNVDTTSVVKSMKIVEEAASKATEETEKVKKEAEEVTQATDKFQSILSSAFGTAIKEGKSFQDTLRSIGASIANLALNSALKPLDNLLAGALGSFFPDSAKPKNFVSSIPNPLVKADKAITPGPVAFAKGGVVAAPSYFDFSGGSGLMGEAGSEAILPLARGPDGKLGVAATQSDNAPANIIFNVNATDAGSFKRSESQISAMLTRAVGRGRRNL